MEHSTEAELYLSFAAIFNRPQPEISDHLEELIELWSEEIPALPEDIQELQKFCAQYPAGESRLNALWEHYIPLFEAGMVEAPPYASVYLGEEQLVMGEEAFAVHAFYEKAGYSIAEKAQELPDHLAVELEFSALLARDGKDEVLVDFRRKHLLPFLELILPRIQKSQRPIYSNAAKLLEFWQLQSQESR